MNAILSFSYNEISWCYIIALLRGTFEPNSILASLLFKSNGQCTTYKTRR